MQVQKNHMHILQKWTMNKSENAHLHVLLFKTYTYVQWSMKYIYEVLH